MKLLTIFLVLFISVYAIASHSNHGIYYSELKAFKKNPQTQALFEQDVNSGSYSTRCNLGGYNPSFLDNSERELFSYPQCDVVRRTLSLGNIQRQIMISKKLSLIDRAVLIGLCGKNDDFIIVTHETMPVLYNYVSSLARKARIAMPFLFISLKNRTVFSRKILGFRGAIVIGQQLFHNVSDEELEALIAQHIGHIKYHHINKEAFVNAIALAVCIAPALSSLLVSKQFAQEADMFASEIAGKAKGLITFYGRLKEKDTLRAAEYDEISAMLMENAAHISTLSYAALITTYYMAQIERYIQETYKKYAYPSNQERIDSAKKYLAQQEA